MSLNIRTPPQPRRQKQHKRAKSIRVSFYTIHHKNSSQIVPGCRGVAHRGSRRRLLLHHNWTTYKYRLLLGTTNLALQQKPGCWCGCRWQK